MFLYLGSSIALALASIIVYIYYFKNGQFDDPEDVKFQIFRDEFDNNH